MEVISPTPDHLRNRSGEFLFDLALIMHDDAARLQKVSELRRRAAADKILDALGVGVKTNIATI
jgi:hypothetical protein